MPTASTRRRARRRRHRTALRGGAPRATGRRRRGGGVDGGADVGRLVARVGEAGAVGRRGRGGGGARGGGGRGARGGGGVAATALTVGGSRWRMGDVWAAARPACEAGGALEAVAIVRQGLWLPPPFVERTLRAHAAGEELLLGYPVWAFAAPPSELNASALADAAAASLHRPPLRRGYARRGWALLRRLPPSEAAPLPGDAAAPLAAGAPLPLGVWSVAAADVPRLPARTCRPPPPPRPRRARAPASSPARRRSAASRFGSPTRPSSARPSTRASGRRASCGRRRPPRTGTPTTAAAGGAPARACRGRGE